MKKFIASFQIALALLTGCANLEHREAPQDPRLTCGKATATGKAYGWCIEAPAHESTSRDVIYFFHGNGGSERSYWESPTYRGLRARWKPGAQPAIIAFSFGPSWYLGEEAGPAGAIADDLTEKEIFPALEAKLPFKPRQRIVFGESQGGFNATQIFLRHPANVERVALTCPAIPGLNPRATDSEIDAFAARQPGAEREVARAWFRKMAERFPTPKIWEAHDPLRRADQMPPTSPELYIVCGNRDPYGFLGPAREFAAKVEARGIPTHFQNVENGGHCAQNEASLESLAAFLADGLPRVAKKRPTQKLNSNAEPVFQRLLLSLECWHQADEQTTREDAR